MPLVSQSIVSRWYSRNSWVYTHFSYLFQNPVWSKNVPGGFSLCPYFWLALFSMFIFRPMIWGWLLTRFLFSWWKPGKIVDWMDRVVCGQWQEGRRGRSIGIIWVLMAVSLPFLFSFETYTEAGLLRYSLIPTLLFEAMLIIAFWKESRKASKECNPQNYLIVAGVLALAIFGTISPSDLLEVLWFPFWLLMATVAIGAKGIWIALGWVAIKATSFFFFVIEHWLFSSTVAVVASIASWIAWKLEVKYNWTEDLKMSQLKRNAYKYLASLVEPNVLSDLDKVRAWIPGSLNAREIIEQAFSGWAAEFTNGYFKEYMEFMKHRFSEAYERNINFMVLEFNSHQEHLDQEVLARNEKCHELTAQVGRLSYPIVWGARQIATFFAMIRDIIKSRKQGVCPYLTFK